MTKEKIAKTFKICHLWTLFGQQGQHQVNFWGGWNNHPFSQRNKTTETAVGLEVGGDREGVEQNLKI